MMLFFKPQTLIVLGVARWTQALTFPRTTTPTPPSLKPLFTANIYLGKTLPPVDISGGIRAVVPILGNSTVTGPAINGTILGGFAHPAMYNNTKLPAINAYGKTTDGYTFIVSESGVEPNGLTGFTRIIIEVGGPYAGLNDFFIVMRITDTNSGVIVNPYGLV